MAHEVETMAYFGQTPWHRLGTPLAEADLYDWETACAKAGLDWEAEVVPLVTADTQQPVSHVAVRRKTDGRILGTVGPRYTVLQNRAAFRWFSPLLDAREAAPHTAGSLRNGSRVWVLAKLNRDPLVIAQGDEVEKFILLSHGHDGSLAVRCGFSPIRVVCQNTLAMARGADASRLIRIKHTKEIHQNLDNIRAVMNLANEQFEAAAEQYRLLARKSINQEDLAKYVRKVLKIEDDLNPSTRTRNVMEGLIGLFEAGRGNDLPAIRGTLWAAYNAVSEWLAFQRGRGEDNRLNSLWFGDSAAVNRHALETAMDPATQIPEYSGRGRHPTRPVRDSVKSVKEVGESLPQGSWRVLCLREGSGEPVVFEFAAVRVWALRDSGPGPAIWLVLRRPVGGVGEVKYYVSNGDEQTPLETLALVTGCRIQVEEYFEDGKGHLGMGHYEGRSWAGWHHHMAMVALAHLLVTGARLRLRTRKSGLSLDMAMRLLKAALPRPVLTVEEALRLVDYHCRRNEAAKRSHTKRWKEMHQGIHIEPLLKPFDACLLC